MTETTVVDRRLLGTWKSEKARTLNEWAYNPDATPDQQARIAAWFGKLTVRYTAARVFTEFEGERTTCSYRVVAIDPDSVAIVCKTDGRDEIRHIHFIEENLYWVSVSRNREFFARVLRSAPQSTQLTRRSANEA